MSEVKTALKGFLDRYIQKSKDLFGELPMGIYIKDCDLFVSEPDKEGYAYWMYKEADKTDIAGLNDELTDFFGSYYYVSVDGEVETSFEFYDSPMLQFTLHGMLDEESVRQEVTPGSIVELCPCEVGSYDEMVLCYDQTDKSLFVMDYGYDAENPPKYELGMSLAEFFNNAESVI